MTDTPNDDRDIEARGRLTDAQVNAIESGAGILWAMGKRPEARELRGLLARPAPEALGAAGVELSDAEIEAVWNCLGYRTKYTAYLRDFARAILAKSKGDQS